MGDGEVQPCTGELQVLQEGDQKARSENDRPKDTGKDNLSKDAREPVTTGVAREDPCYAPEVKFIALLVGNMLMCLCYCCGFCASNKSDAIDEDHSLVVSRR